MVTIRTSVPINRSTPRFTSQEHIFWLSNLTHAGRLLTGIAEAATNSNPSPTELEGFASSLLSQKLKALGLTAIMVKLAVGFWAAMTFSVFSVGGYLWSIMNMITYMFIPFFGTAFFPDKVIEFVKEPIVISIHKAKSFFSTLFKRDTAAAST